MKQAQALDCLAALSHETRLAIVRLLVSEGPRGLPAGEIGARVTAPASRLSFHLGVLERAALIASRREGRQVIYRVRPQALGGLIAYLWNDCACCSPAVGGHCGGAMRA